MKLNSSDPAGATVTKSVQAPSPQPSPLFSLRLRKILVPVDFSTCSRKALLYAIPFARQFQARLLLLHVVQPYIPAGELASIGTEFMQRELCNESQKRLDAFQKDIDADVSSEAILRVGSAYFEIINIAREQDVDLIIISTHGHTGLTHVFLGSTTERVVRYATCPVLVVREHEHEFVTRNSGTA